jgi:NADPH:quinone reductase
LIAAAGRPESIEWCEAIGADHMLNHRTEKLLKDQLREIGMEGVDFVFDLYKADCMANLILLLKPLGAIAILRPPSPTAWAKIDLRDLFLKRKTLFMEAMFCQRIYDVKPKIQSQTLSWGQT